LKLEMAYGEGKHDEWTHPGGHPIPRPPSRCM
jgi:hypothetical protein